MSDPDAVFDRPRVSPALGHDFEPGGEVLSVHGDVDPSTVCRHCLLGRAAHRGDNQQRAASLHIDSGWLVDDVGKHTCGAGPDGHYGAHEPGCGLEPLMKVEELVALFDALTALGIPINCAPEELPNLTAAAEARGRAEVAAKVKALADKWLAHAKRTADDDGYGARAWWDASFILRALVANPPSPAEQAGDAR